MKKSLLTFFAAFALLASSTAIAKNNVIWQQMEQNKAAYKGERVISPNKYLVYAMNTKEMRKQLLDLSEDYNQAVIIELPNPDGEMRRFRIWQTPMMEKGLAERYPEIKTYTAELVGHRFVTAKINISPAGFNAMVFDLNGSYFVDPLSNVEDDYYQVYYKNDYPRTSDWRCDLSGDNDNNPGGESQELGNTTQEFLNRSHGTQRKTYRLALACTQEYAARVGGATPTKASVLAAMVLIINRVNGVYEREIAVSLSLIANTDTLIFLSNDPYTNDNGSSMLGQNQTTVTNRIGSANYDIGHVFSTGGGGIAQLGCVCNSNSKARGVTGLPNPVGDAFAIDYVAHEMGHQFAGNHTFETTGGSCGGGNRNRNTAYEPGSGSTIQAYAGICAPDNIQSNSDAYFHSVSLKEISTFLTTGSGRNCGTAANSSNTPNTVPSFTATYNIPFYTPFELTAPAVTDGTRDTLTYCWEQWDLTNSSSGTLWANLSATGPLFRTILPDTSRTRVFPRVARLLANTYTYLGEKLPVVARDLNFILVTRDIYQGWGAFNSTDDGSKITVKSVVTDDTFRVQAPSGGTTTWAGGSQATVTWTVAGTNTAPINTANVDIFVSTDGGYTWPYQVATAVPNTGSATVTVPSITANTSLARVKVKGSGNVFFHISSANFKIDAAPPASVADVAWANAVSLYPVPAHQHVTLKVEGNTSAKEIVVLNAVGQQVWTGKISGFETVIDVASWAKGIYTVQIVDPATAERISRKLLVN